MDSDTLTSLLRSKKTQDRIRAAESFDTADATHVPLVLEVLSDSTHYVAAIAARKLAADPPEGIERQIIKAYRERDANGPANDPGCHIRTHLALTFGKLHVHPAIDDLKRGIKLRQWEYVGGVRTDTAVGLRGNCALALSQLAPVDAARDIAVLLYDGAGDPLDRTLEARKAAARALGRLGDQAALVALTLRLNYPDGENPEVLAECMDAVVETRDERGMELLKPLLRHDDAHLAAQAALAIARTGLDEAVPLLVDVCDRLRGDLLRAVALSLSAMRTDASRKALREQATSVREEARMAAIEALSTAPDADSRAVLENLAATDTSPRVREAARRSLGG